MLFNDATHTKIYSYCHTLSLRDCLAALAFPGDLLDDLDVARDRADDLSERGHVVHRQPAALLGDDRLARQLLELAGDGLAVSADAGGDLAVGGSVLEQRAIVGDEMGRAQV